MWDAMCEVAARLDQRAQDQNLTVVAKRRWSLLFITEGLWVGDNWTDVFEPVRRRPHFVFGLWRELQTVHEASSAIGTFLRERPDLRS